MPDGTLRAACTSSEGLDETHLGFPRRSMERIRSSSRRVHQQTWRCATQQVSPLGCVPRCNNIRCCALYQVLTIARKFQRCFQRSNPSLLFQG